MIENSNLDKVPFLIIGLILVVYGASIYILLPLSLISSDFGLLLLVFFGILIGMIFGLTLFVSNF
jgi:NADH:ubiquinone oxidoreductase subunit 3 (subunit A)